MHIHGRNRVLLGALIAAFALLIPANAFASHDLGIYRVEQQVTLDSDQQTADLSCDAGDIALDGMWRVDHADQDDDDLYKTALGRAVDVLEAYPKLGFGVASNGHRDTYHYLFEKNAIGRVQLKVFMTCIRQDTHQTSGHSHAIQVTNFTSGGGDPGTFSSTPCNVKEFVSTPGFKIAWTGEPGTDPVPYLGRVSTSWPTPTPTPSSTTSNMRSWDWVIDLSQDTGTPSVTYYWSCVKRALPLSGGERHKLVYRYDGQLTHSIGASSVQTVRQSCGAAYKAVVAGISFPFSNAFTDPNTDYPFATFPEPYVWWLGMDPQPKSRDFKFLNADSAAHNVKTAAICLNYRTT
jgi:hypothetical protein